MDVAMDIKKLFKNIYLHDVGRAALLLLMGVAMQHAAAQPYPNRPLRMIVTSGPGGGPDIAARQVANELGLQLGQQVVVDNRPGASGIIGYETLARAMPDGYTLAYIATGFGSIPSAFSKLPFDSARDFQPIVQLASGGTILAVFPPLPIHSVKDLIELARAKPGTLSFGSSGVGTSQHLAMELFKVMTATNMVHVSYKNIQQAHTDVIGGQIPIVCDSSTALLPHVKSGRLRALGVTTLKRSSALPEVPTVDEAGVPGFEITLWGGFSFPARTPRDLVLRLNAEINKVLLSPSVSKSITDRGSILVGGTPEQFAEHLKRETAKWAGVIKAAGIKPQ
jgi:tripartite-type tricarboxylate transporter receptor subunit TctC